MRKLIIIILTLYSIHNVNAQWQQINGPGGGRVTAIVNCGNNIFVSSFDGGVFLSTNNGANWKAINMELYNVGVNSLSVCGDRIFAGTNHGIYFSTNNGSNWNHNYNDLSEKRIICLAAKDSIVFATANDSGLYLSEDNGSNWKLLFNGLPKSSILSIAINGSSIFAGSNSDGVYLSTNKGKNWKAVCSGLPNYKNEYYYGINSIKAIEKKIFVATQQGIYYTTNNGTSWNACNNGINAKEILALAVSGSALYAGSESFGLYFSTNNGTSWKSSSEGLNGAYVESMEFIGSNMAVKSILVVGTNIFAGTSDDGVFLSTNNGKNWKRVNYGQTNIDINLLEVNGNNLYAGIKNKGIFLSTNKGADWSSINKGFNSSDVYTLLFEGENIFAGTFGGLFVSSNNGNCWKNVGIINTGVYSLAMCGNDIYACINGYNGNGLLLSTNYGTNWDTIRSEKFEKFVYSLAVNRNIIYTGIASDGISVSTDSGKNWKSADKLSPIPYSFAFNGDSAYAVAARGLYLSTNNGSSWNYIQPDLKQSGTVTSLSVNNGNIFAGTFRREHYFEGKGIGGIILSTNNGASWKEVNTGLPEDIYVNKIVISKTDVYIGTMRNGIWKRPLLEMLDEIK